MEFLERIIVKKEMKNKRVLIVCTTDSMIWNFLVPHITALKEKGFYVECACSKTGFFFDELILKYNITVNEICFKRTPYSLKNIAAYFALKKLIKQKGFDIVFCHEPVGGALGRMAGHKCGCKVIYMAHGFHFYKGAPKTRGLYYCVERHLSKYTDTLITINQEDYEASLKFKARNNVLLHGIGIDVSRFSNQHADAISFKDNLKIERDALIFLSVGELIPRKNHETVIKAMGEIKNKKILYLIAGQGRLYNRLSHLIETLGLQKQVRLLGFRKDIDALCSIADVFVLPSIHEGLSVALMEAMACNKPVICSKIRGNVDLVDEGKGGFCVSNKVANYVDAMNRFLDDKTLINQFGEYNGKKVKNYDITIVREELLKVFEHL